MKAYLSALSHTRRKQTNVFLSYCLSGSKANSPLSSIVADPTPLPDPASNAEEDENLFAADPWIEPPIHVDYGTNLHLDPDVFINFNCTILDTCAVTIGARTLIASNVSLYSGTHPLGKCIVKLRPVWGRVAY